MNGTKTAYRNFIALAVGAFIGAMLYPVMRARREVQQWQTAQQSTADAWMTDRRAWRDGQPFAERVGKYRKHW